MARAQELRRRGYAAFDAGDWASAGPALAELAAVETEPDQAAVRWFDAALAAKFARDWPNAITWGREAAAPVERGSGEPTFWNLGIAATAVGDWALAREAWAGFGITLPDGDGPIVADLGRACVRLHTSEAAEVARVERLCPARARVISVPYDPDRRFGDVVLHDGEPNGRRELGDGTTFTVFDEIVVLSPSPIPTTLLSVTGEASDIAALDDLIFEAGGALESGDATPVTCRCCSQGTLDVTEPEHRPGVQDVRVAHHAEQLPALLDRWRDTRPETRAWTLPAP